MKICLITPQSQNVEPWIPVLQQKGVEVLLNEISEDCDFIVCTGQARLNLWKAAHEKFPHIPMINYTWDFYEWTWKDQRGVYDWKGYGEYLQKCVELWCHSEEVVKRMEEYFGISDKCKIILTWFRKFEASDDQIIDKRYVYNPLRQYYLDPNYGWTKKACAELGIPYVETVHTFDERDFQKVLLECSFTICEYYEASTGGLTLLEGYYHGKPCIVSDSPYMGAKDYLGDKGIYFKYDDYENLKKVLKETWDNPPKLDLKETRKAFDHLDIDIMIDKMIDRMNVLKNG